MLKAVDNAKHTITFESFVNKRSDPVRAFTKAFAERARAGVKVHLILDRFGSKHWGDEHLTTMRSAGVEVRFYSPLNILLPHRYNHRTHRRVLVVDGRVGFTGGAGWTDRWVGDAQSPEYWRDTQFEMRGPVVRQLQECFNDNWEELTGHRLAGTGYFPPLRRAGDLTAQHVTGSPGKNGTTIGDTYLLAIKAARKNILLEHSYFVPPREIQSALIDAADRGVQIDIIIPGEHTDMPIALNAASRSYRKLMAAGIRLHRYQPTMMHNKLMIVDDRFVSIGSANIDGRSFFINDENNVHVLNRDFAAEQSAMFRRDLERCLPLTPDDLPNSILDLPLNTAAQLLAPQL
jgi:cardiolipin synthase